MAPKTPLFTRAHCLVDSSGTPVRLNAINWPCHMDTMLPEGLQHLPIDAIAAKIADLGFNAVRLTYALDMTREWNANMTARASFSRLGLQVCITEVEANNPELIDLPVFEVFKRAVTALKRHDVMVILDNHTGHAGWFPSTGNGFWGDEFFHPNDWLRGLCAISGTFRGEEWSNVVGFSLRNELFGPNCSTNNLHVWYEMMRLGASIVHYNCPDALVIMGGLWFHSSLEHIRLLPMQSQLPPSARSKIMYEWHWYNGWYSGNSTALIDHNVGFVLQQGNAYTAPLFLSEFGCCQQGFDYSSGDCAYMLELIDYVTRADRWSGMNWAMWEFFGDYYTREGLVGCVDSWGLMKRDLSDIRSHEFMHLLKKLMQHHCPVDLPPMPGFEQVPRPLACRARTYRQWQAQRQHSAVGHSWIHPKLLGPMADNDAYKENGSWTLIVPGMALDGPMASNDVHHADKWTLAVPGMDLGGPMASNDAHHAGSATLGVHVTDLALPFGAPLPSEEQDVLPSGPAVGPLVSIFMPALPSSHLAPEQHPEDTNTPLAVDSPLPCPLVRKHASGSEAHEAATGTCVSILLPDMIPCWSLFGNNRAGELGAGLVIPDIHPNTNPDNADINPCWLLTSCDIDGDGEFSAASTAPLLPTGGAAGGGDGATVGGAATRHAPGVVRGVDSVAGVMAVLAALFCW